MKSLDFSALDFFDQLKFYASLSRAWEKFYNLRPEGVLWQTKKSQIKNTTKSSI